MSRLYPTATTSADAPSSGERSTALPVGTFVDASGNTNGRENGLMSETQGSFGVSVTWNSLGQTADQDTYISRWVSAALPAGSIAANTWTFAFGGNEGNAAANVFVMPVVYVWRPSGGGSVVGTIYDSHTALGNEWATTNEGRVVTFAGSGVTVQQGDVLVLEAWAHAIQSMTTSYSNLFNYAGTDTITEASTPAFGTYLETPQDLFAVALFPPFPPPARTLLAM